MNHFRRQPTYEVNNHDMGGRAPTAMNIWMIIAEILEFLVLLAGACLALKYADSLNPKAEEPDSIPASGRSESPKPQPEHNVNEVRNPSKPARDRTPESLRRSGPVRARCKVGTPP